MKIGILTIHKSPNYGATIQCYALWKFLVDSGFEAEVIDLYRPNAFEDYVPSRKYRRSREVKKSFFTKVKNVLKHLLVKDKFKSLYNSNAKIKFDKFNDMISYSGIYKSVDSLYKNCPEYDIYIAGSDQLWNPTQVYCIEPYFLTFVKNKKAKKISYATSIGVTELLENEKCKFRSWLSSFFAISVRERQAQILLSSFVDRKIEQVADPTFLLDIQSWENLCAEIQNENYVLLFSLGPNSELLEYARKLSKESGKKLIVVGQSEPDAVDSSYLVYNDLGPEEWLGIIKNADLVITNSFHCTVFSILLGTCNFFTYIESTSKRGSRITDLLETFGLENHLLDVDLNQSFDELYANVIDRARVLEIYQNEQEKSRSFLLSNITK